MREIFNIRQIEAFRAVIEHGSVSRAATSLFITQSAVSKLITALEEDSGLKLFERCTGRLCPTPAALQLYETSDRVFAGLMQFNRKISTLKNENQRVFSVGVLPALASQYSAEVCKLFSEQHPEIRLSLVVGNSPYIKDLLINRKLDVGIISTPVNHPSFMAEPVLSSFLVCVLPLDHPLSGEDCIHAKSLHQVNFVDYNPEDQSSTMQRKIFDQHCVCPSYAIDGTTASVVINLVASGFGVGLVHPASAHWRRKDLCIRPFLPQTPISYYFCHDSQAYNASLIDSFAECMDEVYYKVFQKTEVQLA